VLHRRAADAAALRRRLPALSTEQTSGGTALHQLQEVRTSQRKHRMLPQFTQLCAAQRTGHATQSRPSAWPRGCLRKAWQRVRASSAAMPSARASEERGHNRFRNRVAPPPALFVEEVSTGGAAPAEGEEGGRSRSPNGPGRAPYWGPAGITPPETPVSDAAGAPHPFNLLDEATGSKAGEAAAEALAEAAVDAVYGALVAATLEEWAGASTDNPVSAEDARGPGLECQDCFENFYKEYDVEPWLWRRALREGWSELGGWSREEMEAAEKEIWRGESSEISQLGEWVCDACLEGYLGGGVGDYSELRSGYVAPYPSNPWIGRSRDLSWMRKGPIGVTRREALLAAEEAKAAARAAEKAARAAEGGKGGGSGRQSREARRRKGSSSRGGVRTARREDEEPEPGEGWEGGARPEEYDGLFDGP